MCKKNEFGPIKVHFTYMADYIPCSENLAYPPLHYYK